MFILISNCVYSMRQPLFSVYHISRSIPIPFLFIFYVKVKVKLLDMSWEGKIICQANFLPILIFSSKS